ncbi:RtcB family protein [Desulfuromonas thiophila]|uniref:3'-phosphate/5'-hydroxy nucleic acid ligase n=1 Tax=Desulfuromonas thiophila TaxID=57664 RepID=A0A1G7ES30_9BACT|nr:RtcB family protein [Desulfuromonas thiophila]SDE66453.1 tRNA-splicing ligase RtcB [Desulfuromonas thiophila]
MRPLATRTPYHIFASNVEEAALRQFESALQQPFTLRGALMPDAHSGYALPIGAVVATAGVVVPAWVGYDIGCGLCALPTSFSRTAVQQVAGALFKALYQSIPVGFAHNRADTPWPAAASLPASPFLRQLFGQGGLRQLGSLGSGNHFIEIGHDENDRVWIIVHSGSRALGHAVASHYMRLASPDGKPREGHFGFNVSQRNGRNYLQDLAFCLAFALENRRELARRVETVISRHCHGAGDWSRLINRNHNHAEYAHNLWIHRKGATQAEAGMAGVIPGNMRDGSFIVRGKGHPAALWSSAHGAGRALGRQQARRTLSLADFTTSMQGVVARIEAATLDEAPAAYKDIHQVMAQQHDLVEIVAWVRPILNIKG